MPKLTLAGAAPSVGETPVPDSGMSSGDAVSLLAMRSIAVLVAAEVGLKTMETVVLLPPAMVDAGVAVIENFSGSDVPVPSPTIVAEDMFAMPEPELAIVMELAALVVL